ncbi:hypothetical protein OYE22_11525 [Streptomyces sp. 71268]|uniref:hypothetical protein n=1 Tax=Streptomyces sp. 71268 TaxID=3002640 RepID=UPI0023F6B021|nr:hypothetical protein [Streptomyces sp. 71268]WEV25763.1 hypothetical protein OYE22_11525 [Streptomyces sp. 71268]
MFSRERIAPFAGMPYGLPGQPHPAQPTPAQPLPLRDLDRRPAHRAGVARAAAPLGVAA